jgi:tetratricopeptide (TPR) repeat protein
MGNCQLAAVESVMHRHLAREFGLRTHFVESWTELSDSDRDILDSADIIIGQRLRFTDRSDVEDLQTRGSRILVPLLSASFLWPFAGMPHPRNASFPFHRYGPYPAEIGDSYLNRQIAEGVDPDVAVEKYARLEVNSVVNLDRLREISVEYQYTLDEVTGFRMAPHMEAIQEQYIFRTPHHFDTSILVELTCQIVEKIGLSNKAAELVRTSAKLNPMLDVWLPIHPSVARHFKLRYGDEQQRYPYFGEGAFTFGEYARRYMTFTWNSPLHEGIHLSLSGCDAAALPKLRDGLALSPASSAGHFQLSQSLVRCEDMPAAIQSASRAVELALDDAPAHKHLARLLAAVGDVAQAEAAARVAVSLDPLDADLHAWLGWLILGRGDASAALGFIENAVEITPAHPEFLLLRGDALLAAGRITEAVAEFRRVIEIDPSLPAGYASLSQALARLHRWDDALAAVQDALARAPENPDLVFFLARVWAELSRPAEAESAHRAAIALAPVRAEFHAGLASFLTQAGQPAAALPAIRQALLLAPDNSDYQALRNYLIEAFSLERT